MSFIDQKEIFEKTNGGKDVILRYYPNSAASFENPTRKFKIRDQDKTASASLKKQPDGVWVVTDFGDDASKHRNAIAIVMHEENLGADRNAFKKAIQIIAQMFGIIPEDKMVDVFKPEIHQRDATPEEEEGVWYFELKDFTEAEVKTILAPKTWDYLIIRAPKKEAKTPTEVVIDEVVRIFKKYHFYSLKSYKIVKNRRVTEIESTNDYPIFMFDEGSWKKIYQPRNKDKGMRFMHYGKRPNNFIFGEEQANKAHQELTKIEDDTEDMYDDDAKKHKEKKDKKKAEKLEKLIITSGGSDGLNLACIGQCFNTGKERDQLAAQMHPVWMNSETAKLSIGQFNNLAKCAQKVYNLPDIDITGRREAHNLAMEHLDIHTINLPEQLREQKDPMHKKPCKDLRDYLRYWTPWDFEKLFKTAYPYKFWDTQPQFNKQGEFLRMGYVVNNKYLLNFLHRNGFYRYPVDMEDDTYFYIHIEHNVVTKVGPKKIRDYINQFIEARFPEVELMNTFLRTTQMNETGLSSLPYANIDFQDFDQNNQWFFYSNKTVCVNAEGIQDFRPGDIDKFVWKEEVIQYRYTKLDDFFHITCHPNGDYDINIVNQECLVLRYLINGSRLFWREELENRIDGIKEEKRGEYATHHNLTEAEHKLMDGLNKEEREAYLKDYKWNITGPLLTKAEQQEQKMHLINKIYAVGHAFHRYKSPSRAWAIWTMDAKLSDGNESHGGSGKSLLPNLVFNYGLMKTKYIGASDPRVLEDKHVKEGITEHTDLIFVDDCSRYFNFRYFFADITTATVVNPKNSKATTIPFDKSPKMWFTSNYPPFDIDASKARRLLYTLYSDYYHENASGEYRETRSPYDDFGKNLGRDFDEKEWNLFLNFIQQCVKFYLNTEEKLNPPMDNINKRNLKASMGDAFQGWADVYFSDTDRINTEKGDDNFVIHFEAMEDFKKSTGQNSWTTQKFNSALKAWCRYFDYELNPEDVQGWQAFDSGRGGRIIRKVKIKDKAGIEKSTSKEVIHIRVPKKVDVEDDPLPF